MSSGASRTTRFVLLGALGKQTDQAGELVWVNWSGRFADLRAYVNSGEAKVHGRLDSDRDQPGESRARRQELFSSRTMLSAI